MSDHRFPQAYRWLIQKGLTNWEPWYFVDDVQTINAQPDLARSDFFQREFRTETGADYEVYLFARRQDREDFAFFVRGTDDLIEDNVITWHLTFSGRFESFIKQPFQRPAEDKRVNLFAWVRHDLIADIEDWIAMGDDS